MASTATLPGQTYRSEVPDRESTAPVVEKPAGPTTDERIASLERELGETRESAKIWEGIANNRPTPTRVAATDDRREPSDAGIDWGKDDDIAAESDDVTAEALLDDLSKSGLKALSKHGFVRKSEVVRIAREEGRKAAATASNQVVQRARSEVTTESKIMGEFPDLADPKSEFYGLVRDHVIAAVNLDPSAEKSPTTLYLAARAAKAELAGQAQPRGRQQDDDDQPVPQRTERQERIAAQSGDRGRGARSSVDTGREDGPGLTADQLEAAKALGVDPKKYKEELTKLQRQQPARGRR